MRFGIMAMQIGALIPSDVAPSQIAAHVAGFNHAALVERLHGYGFDPVELGGDLVMFMPHTYAEPAIEKLAALQADTGLRYTVHLPLWSVEPAALLEPVRAGSVQALAHVLKATLPLDVEAYVIHSTGALAAEFYRKRLPEGAHWVILKQFQGRALESLKALLGETGVSPRKLAVETIEFPLELTMELVEGLDLSYCLDTGHVLSGFSGPIDLFDAVKKLLPRLANVHLHDSPRWVAGTPIVYGQDHQALGRGALDLGRFLDRLHEGGYAGPLVFELTVPEALASLEVVRQVRPEYIT
jgi:sugar phosphate isomerase/epimerase